MGLGGVGKSALVVHLMNRLAKHFEGVIWRSLSDLTSCEAFIEGLIQVLAPEALDRGGANLERLLDLLLEQMRTTRLLLVLENLEALLEEKEASGRMCPELAGFESFLKRIAETEHRSCVLLTSREAPAVLAPLVGSQARARSFRLASLDAESCDRLLSENKLIGSGPERLKLIEAYSGNPLALKIAARTIADLFNGEIAPFLKKGEVIIGGVRSLLEEQFDRLSRLEQSLLLWFTIQREPTTIDKLLEIWSGPVSRARVLEALDDLYHRSLIERRLNPHEFALPALFIRYLQTWLVNQISVDDQEGKFERLIENSLELAQPDAPAPVHPWLTSGHK